VGRQASQPVMAEGDVTAQRQAPAAHAVAVAVPRRRRLLLLLVGDLMGGLAVLGARVCAAASACCLQLGRELQHCRGRWQLVAHHAALIVSRLPAASGTQRRHGGPLLRLLVVVCCCCCCCCVAAAAEGDRGGCNRQPRTSHTHARQRWCCRRWCWTKLQALAARRRRRGCCCCCCKPRQHAVGVGCAQCRFAGRAAGKGGHAAALGSRREHAAHEVLLGGAAACSEVAAHYKEHARALVGMQWLRAGVVPAALAHRRQPHPSSGRRLKRCGGGGRGGAVGCEQRGWQRGIEGSGCRAELGFVPLRPWKLLSAPGVRPLQHTW
jgi:hypothetical protein